MTTAHLYKKTGPHRQDISKILEIVRRREEENWRKSGSQLSFDAWNLRRREEENWRKSGSQLSFDAWKSEGMGQTPSPMSLDGWKAEQKAKVDRVSEGMGQRRQEQHAAEKATSQHEHPTEQDDELRRRAANL